MEFYDILFKAGIWISFIGLLFLIISLLTGLRVIRPRKPIRHFHKKLSITTFVLICTHAVIMIYFYFFT